MQNSVSLPGDQVHKDDRDDHDMHQSFDEQDEVLVGVLAVAEVPGDLLSFEIGPCKACFDDDHQKADDEDRHESTNEEVHRSSVWLVVAVV